MIESAKSIDTKDNKFLIQMLVNEENGRAFSKAISNKDSQIGNITWLSPLRKFRYKQYRLYQEQIYKNLNLKKEDIETLPMNQPLWDAIGTSKDTIILVEGDSSNYLIGSSLSFLNKLRGRGYKAKLVLLNVVNHQNFMKHPDDNDYPDYKQIFNEMYGRMETPKDVILLDYYIK